MRDLRIPTNGRDGHWDGPFGQCATIVKRTTAIGAHRMGCTMMLCDLSILQVHTASGPSDPLWIPIVAALTGAVVTALAFILRPVSSDDATRRALHELEFFCPPSWGFLTVAEARAALSRLYRELQYASRGRSFIITRAAAWRMDKLLRERVPQSGVLSVEESMQLYIWKTVIACALGRQIGASILQGPLQRCFLRRARRVVRDTAWVVKMYNKMNALRIPDPAAALDQFYHELQDERA